MADYFDVILQGVADREEEREAVAAAAERAPVTELVQAALGTEGAGEVLVKALLLEAARASVGRLEEQDKSAHKTIRAEVAVLKKGNPGTVRPIRDVDVAEERARRKLKPDGV